MNEWFLRIVNMSLTASVIGGAVLALRALLRKKLPRWTFYLLWAVVLARLLLPFSPSSPASAFNAIPAARPVVSGDRAAIQFVGDTGAAVEFPTLRPGGAPEQGDGAGLVVRPSRVPVTAILARIWLCGVVLLLCYSLGCYLYTLHRLRRAERLPHTPELDAVFRRVGVSPGRVRLYRCDLFASPVVCGLVRPRLVLSGLVEAEDLPHVAAHELTHVRRRDNLWKALATLALYLHWFNPFLWLCYRWYVADMEASCDEAVVSRLGADRRAYAYSLVNMAAKSRSAFAGGFLAFGECALKERITSIMNVRKHTVVLSIMALAVVAGMAVVFLTNPQGGGTPAAAAPPSSSQPQEAPYALLERELSVLSASDVRAAAVRRRLAEGERRWEVPGADYTRLLGMVQSLTLRPLDTEDPTGPAAAVEFSLAGGLGLELGFAADGSLGLTLTGGPQGTLAARPVWDANLDLIARYVEQLSAADTTPEENPVSRPQTAAPSGAEAAAPAVSSPGREEAPPELPPVDEDNIPSLKLPYDQIAGVNLIDRETHTCYAVEEESLQLQIAGLLNGLTVTGADLKPPEGEQGLRLLQVRLSDGDSYDYWCYPELLQSDRSFVQGRQLWELYALLDGIQSEAGGARRATAEWLGYMNPYRITGMEVARLEADGETWEWSAERSATASDGQREDILRVAAAMKALTVEQDGVETAPADHIVVPVEENRLYAVKLDFENGAESYHLRVMDSGRIILTVGSIDYALLYRTTGDGTLAALNDLLESFGPSITIYD